MSVCMTLFVDHCAYGDTNTFRDIDSMDAVGAGAPIFFFIIIFVPTYSSKLYL